MSKVSDVVAQEINIKNSHTNIDEYLCMEIYKSSLKYLIHFDVYVTLCLFQNVDKPIPLQSLKPTSSIILTGYIPENASRYAFRIIIFLIYVIITSNFYRHTYLLLAHYFFNVEFFRHFIIDFLLIKMLNHNLCK